MRIRATKTTKTNFQFSNNEIKGLCKKMRAKEMNRERKKQGYLEVDNNWVFKKDVTNEGSKNLEMQKKKLNLLK